MIDKPSKLEQIRGLGRGEIARRFGKVRAKPVLLKPVTKPVITRDMEKPVTAKPMKRGIIERLAAGMCRECGNVLKLPERGPAPTYCSDRCRSAARRARAKLVKRSG